MNTEVNYCIRKLIFKLFKYSLLIDTGLVCFIYKNKYRNFISCKKPPEGFGVALYSIGTADYEDCIVENLECSFHFSRKINMSWCVKKRNTSIFKLHNSLL